MGGNWLSLTAVFKKGICIICILSSILFGDHDSAEDSYLPFHLLMLTLEGQLVSLLEYFIV